MTTVSSHTARTSPLSLAEARLEITALLDHYFETQIADATQIHPNYAQMLEVIHNLVCAPSGGKRLRPYITLLSYQACGGQAHEAVLPAAAAQELLHQATLIHDDIIDRSDVRYGMPNVAGQYDTIYKAAIRDTGERKHFRDSTALLAGDLLISNAYQMLQMSTVEPERILRAQRTLGETIFSIVGGELLDTEASFRFDTVIPTETINHYKSSAYSFIGPLIIGAELAGATEATLDLLRSFGRELGMAFQLRDDVLGIFGDEKQTGKTASGDLLEGKRTYLIEQFYAHANRTTIQEFEKTFGNPDAAPEDLDGLRQFIIGSGALAICEKAIDMHVASAEQFLKALKFSEAYQVAFRELITRSVRRAK